MANAVRGRRVVALVALWTVSGLVLTRPAAAAGIDIRLSKVGGVTTVAQGKTFPFKVTAQNNDTGSRTVTVIVRLQDPTAATKDIRAWAVTVPGGGKVSQQFSEVSAQWFESTGTFILSTLLDGVVSGNTLPYSVTAPTVTVPVFQDVTAAMGLSTILPGDLNRNHSNGAAWADVNGDGYLDLYVPIRDKPAQLWVYQPSSGTFVDQAPAWGVTNPGAKGVSAVFADYDNDGDPDLYVINDAIDPDTALPTGQGNRLYRNDLVQGSSSFTDVSTSAGVDTQGNGASASWGDYDNDGYLDLYSVTNNAYNNDGSPGPKITWFQQDHLFHNERDGTFTDVTCDVLPTENLGAGFCLDPAFGGSTGSGFEATWFDYDHDGDPDLYLAQDYFMALVHKDINRLYRNDGFDPGSGHWKFTEMCAQEPSRAECLQINSMGIAIGDYDNDLRPDVAISNTGANGGNVLLRGKGTTFADVSAQSGIARPIQDAYRDAVTWGLGFYDFNLDGYQDLFVGAGSNQDTPVQPNQLFVGTASRTFLDLSAPSHTIDPGVAHGVAFADFDRDGLVDIYVVNAMGSPILYRNVTATTGHWLEVRLVGTASNRDGCGARVTVTSGSLARVGWVLCGSSLGAGSDEVVHFGGVGAGAFSLDVEWPSGRHQVVPGSAGDRLVTVTEP